MKIGLVSNWRSRRNKRGLPVLPDTRVSGVEILHRPLDGIVGLGDVLRDFAAAEVDILAVNGGDGTVSATLSELLHRNAFDKLPLLALLGGGTTNMTAADAGLRGPAAKALRRLVARTARNELEAVTVERDVIRVDYRPDRAPLYGMFFGTAAICRAIQLCHEVFHPIKVESSAAAGATLAYVFACSLFGRTDKHRLIQGDRMTVRLDGRASEEGEKLLALVTTLDRLVLRSRPFWGKEEGALRYMSIAHPPWRLGRSARRVLYGGADRGLPPEHYDSHNAERISFEMTCPFTLDGEIFEPAPDVPVELSCGGRLSFLHN